jgi:hypothetical protein
VSTAFFESLAVNVISRAARDMASVDGASLSDTIDAAMWLFGDGVEEGSFRWWCAIGGLDAERARESVLRYCVKHRNTSSDIRDVCSRILSGELTLQEAAKMFSVHTTDEVCHSPMYSQMEMEVLWDLQGPSNPIARR